MIEKTVLANLIFNEDYFRKVYPYIKQEYFDDNGLKKIFDTYYPCTSNVLQLYWNLLWNDDN